MNLCSKFAAVGLSLAVLLCGCSATKPKGTEGPESKVPLQASEEFPHSLIYKKPGVDYKKYTKFMIEPVEIYQGKDAQFKKVSESDKQMMAEFIRSEFTRALKQGYEIVDQPGPGVLRMKFTLAGVQLTQTALAAVTHFTPIGMAMNLGRTASGMSGSFVGTVTMAGELYDGEDNTLVASFLTKRGPLAVDVTAQWTGLQASKKAVSDIADKFKATIDKIQGVSAK